MLCIRCNRDSKYPERTKRICPGCQQSFAFEPREGDPVSDMLFKRAIDTVSSLGTVRFGVENLYYEICRRKRSKVAPVWVGVVLLMIGFIVVGALIGKKPHPFFWMIAGGLCFWGLSIIIYRPYACYVAVTATDFRNLYERWCTTHGVPTGVIVRRESPAPTVEAEPDLGDYSFDRAVICDRARTVDLLLANNVHFENNCAILSIDGYPQGPFALVKAMLKRNPKLQVFVLHDTTPEGCRLAHRLSKDPEWFPQGTRIIDVGLRPGHAKQFFGLWQQHSKPVAPGEGLSEEEARWLSESNLELAAVRPQQLIRWLFRAMNSQAGEKAETEVAAAEVDGGVFFYTGGDSHVLVRDIQAVEADFDTFG